ncbi:MAG: hypothetical protein OXI27_07505 [Thaumarchaeota archaeon]|nr:hypothetical protein [Nitrososphaerota archaeon]MDE0526420.1 hypothetical protein [Nitrososphaerota archaeon]
MRRKGEDKHRERHWKEKARLLHVSVRGRILERGQYFNTQADARTVNSWRHRLKKRIPLLKRDRFAIAMADKVFYVRDDAAA